MAEPNEYIIKLLKQIPVMLRFVLSKHVTLMHQLLYTYLESLLSLEYLELDFSREYMSVSMSHNTSL